MLKVQYFAEDTSPKLTDEVNKFLSERSDIEVISILPFATNTHPRCQIVYSTTESGGCQVAERNKLEQSSSEIDVLEIERVG